MPGRNHAAVDVSRYTLASRGESEPPSDKPRSVSYSRPRARTRRCKSRSMRSMVHLSMMRGPNNARSRARSKESKQSTKSVRTTHRWPSSRSATSVRIASPTPTPGRYPNDHGDKSGSMAGVRIWVSARSTTRSSATGTERRRTPAVPFGTGTSFSGCGRHSPARRPSLIAARRGTGSRANAATDEETVPSAASRSSTRSHAAARFSSVQTRSRRSGGRRLRIGAAVSPGPTQRCRHQSAAPPRQNRVWPGDGWSGRSMRWYSVTPIPEVVFAPVPQYPLSMASASSSRRCRPEASCAT